jgi:hypothetical protein
MRSVGLAHKSRQGVGGLFWALAMEVAFGKYPEFW